MILDALNGSGEQRVTSAIRSASASTGMSFDYLLKTAIRESALDPKAKAATSSARGLFQFIDTTWLQTVKDEGANYGLGEYAKSIERSADGQYFVRDPARRAEILKLRENPEAASYMAGAFASRNSAELAGVLGRQPTSGELYIAHFLGAAGAKRLLLSNAANPKAPAAEMFPEAAAANRSIFYRRDGSAKSTFEVYAGLTARHDRTPPPATDAATAVAALPPVQAPKFATVVTPDRTPERLTVANFDYTPHRSYSSFTPENTPAYRSLYQASTARGVSRTVQELWSRDTGQKVALVDTSNVVRVAHATEPRPGIATVARSDRT